MLLSVQSLQRADEILTIWKSAKTDYEHKRLIAIPLGQSAIDDPTAKDLSILKARFVDFTNENLRRMTEPLQGALAMWWRERQYAAQ
ncbi:MAG: hypothetical protein U1E43_01205 [Rhodospirillales bacterium]